MPAIHCCSRTYVLCACTCTRVWIEITKQWTGHTDSEDSGLHWAETLTLCAPQLHCLSVAGGCWRDGSGCGGAHQRLGWRGGGGRLGGDGGGWRRCGAADRAQPPVVGHRISCCCCCCCCCCCQHRRWRRGRATKKAAELGCGTMAARSDQRTLGHAARRCRPTPRRAYAGYGRGGGAGERRRRRRRRRWR
jgi:hypothetical protein